LPPLSWTGLAGPVEEEPPERFLAAVQRAREYIIAGDIFQANLSRQWRAPVPSGADPAALYARLRRSNPGPFAGLARWQNRAVLSSSPERLLSIHDGRSRDPADRGHATARLGQRPQMRCSSGSSSPIRRSAPST
jgi:anthranilate synthase component I